MKHPGQNPSWLRSTLALIKRQSSPADRTFTKCDGTKNSEPDVTSARLRELMGQALSTPSVEAVLEFSAFASRMRRLGPYNIYMVFAQRPGAEAIASRQEWAAAGQTVLPDAIPILILRPKGPIAQVFELSDTLPRRERDPRVDPFAAVGPFAPSKLKKLISSLAGSPKHTLKIDVVLEDFGTNYAGQIVLQLPLGTGSAFEREPSETIERKSDENRPGTWRIKLSRRLNDAEQFATLVHELGHLFCGHVGAFQQTDSTKDESGWPDRGYLPHPIKEIEAELVAWHICERHGLVTGSAVYLKPYMERVGPDITKVDLDRVIRAIAKVEQHLAVRRPNGVKAQQLAADQLPLA